ncbi:uncharacterized protein DDB_G0283697-like [Episyrphus balteatus]|uniref:uncharacterized protein DDB_G0283697-like n=1 Tax=Episyrphus balteatus TaxID=286459 RepID=UPI0024868C30|nr:uncharacterized protein DDB_G0283697-like [Episyrphus balteatus]
MFSNTAVDIFNSLRIPDAIKDVPTFDGNKRLLFDFISNVEEILELMPQLNSNPAYKKVVLRAIRNKVVGPANEALNMYGTDVNWEDIKNNLLIHYADKRNETSLIRDLHQLRQNQSSVETYFSRVIETLSAMINHIKVHETNLSVVEAKQNLYQEMGLNIFLSGLREPLGSTVRSMRPTKIIDAFNFCQHEENYYYFQNSQYRSQIPQTPRFQNRRTFFANTDTYTQRFQQPYNQYQSSQNITRENHNNDLSQNNFRQNTNYRQENIPDYSRQNSDNRQDQRFRQENNSRQINNFRPNNSSSIQSRQSNLSRSTPPEPMDTYSGTTSRRTNRNGQTFNIESQVEENYENLGQSVGYLDLNNHNTNLLPYIIIKSLYKKQLKFLIDTGSNKSFINPEVIENEKIKCIKPLQIKTIFDKVQVNKQINVQNLLEFKTDETLNFLLFKFHNYFDGLIGTDIMKKLAMKIDLKNSFLETEKVKIPLSFKPNLISKMFVVPEQKGKQKSNADALSRIEININQGNNIENLELISFQNNHDEQDKISTLHSAQENLNDGIPVSERPLNEFSNQIILKYEKKTKINPKLTILFKRKKRIRYNRT